VPELPKLPKTFVGSIFANSGIFGMAALGARVFPACK
jgi:hypothetical protein